MGRCGMVVVLAWEPGWRCPGDQGLAAARLAAATACVCVQGGPTRLAPAWVCARMSRLEAPVLPPPTLACTSLTLACTPCAPPPPPPPPPLLLRCAAQVKAMLSRNRSALDALAAALLDQEQMQGEAVYEVLEPLLTEADRQQRQQAAEAYAFM